MSGNGCYGGKKEAVNEQLHQEDQREEQATNDARLLTRDLLLKVGFSDDDIKENASLTVQTLKGKESVSIDFLVSVDGSPFMIIMCSMAPESRERHVIAMARVAFENLPLCASTDGLVSRLYNTASGSLISEMKEDLPLREDLLKEAENIRPVPLSEKRREMETMILMAFEATLCPRVPDDEGKEGK